MSKEENKEVKEEVVEEVAEETAEAVVEEKKEPDSDEIIEGLKAELDKATIATTAPCKDAESVSASSANNGDAISSSVPAFTDDDGDPEA